MYRIVRIKLIYHCHKALDFINVSLSNVSVEYVSVSSGMCLPPVFTPVSCLPRSSNLKRETKSFIQMLSGFQSITRLYIPQDTSL
jgi:hypothetical protein